MAWHGGICGDLITHTFLFRLWYHSLIFKIKIIMPVQIIQVTVPVSRMSPSLVTLVPR
jgi:hypothetical protein